MMENKEFVIDRSTWYRGRGYSHSRLLREDGARCCVGFFASQCLNIPDELLLRQCTLSSISKETGKSPFTLDSVGRAARREITDRRIYTVNDKISITDKEREEVITTQFAAFGYTVKFIN